MFTVSTSSPPTSPALQSQPPSQILICNILVSNDLLTYFLNTRKIQLLRRKHHVGLNVDDVYENRLKYIIYHHHLSFTEA